MAETNLLKIKEELHFFGEKKEKVKEVHQIGKSLIFSNTQKHLFEKKRSVQDDILG